MRLKCCYLAYALVLVSTTPAHSQEEDRLTVDGPRNLALYDGANQLRAGNAEEGVRLTLRGLETAKGDYEFMTAYTNLCAGYVLLGDMDRAVSYCDKAISRNKKNSVAFTNRALAYLYSGKLEEAERDLNRGLAINPNGSKLRRVKQLIEDAKNPVEPQITIKDRPLTGKSDE